MENAATWLTVGCTCMAIANDMRDTRDEQTMREIASKYELLATRAGRSGSEKEP